MEQKLKYFLKLLEKEGYPNRNVETLQKTLSYSPEEFLNDLWEWDKEKANSFVLTAMRKLYDDDKGIKIDDFPTDGSYIHVLVSGAQIIISENFVEAYIKRGHDSKVILDGEEMTLDEYIDQLDYDYPEFDNSLEDMFCNLVAENCGFYVVVEF